MTEKEWQSNHTNVSYEMASDSIFIASHIELYIKFNFCSRLRKIYAKLLCIVSNS